MVLQEFHSLHLQTLEDCTTAQSKSIGYDTLHHEEPKDMYDNPMRHQWKALIQEELAQKWMEDLPDAALEIVRNKRLAAGSALVKLDSEVTRPSFKD